MTEPVRTGQSHKTDQMVKAVEKLTADLVKKHYVDQANRKKQAMKRVIQTLEGRMILYDILSELLLFGDVFDPNSTTMARNVGLQSAAQKIQKRIYRIDPKFFHMMEAEAFDRQQAMASEIEVEVAKLKKKGYKDGTNE